MSPPSPKHPSPTPPNLHYPPTHTLPPSSKALLSLTNLPSIETLSERHIRTTSPKTLSTYLHIYNPSPQPLSPSAKTLRHYLRTWLRVMHHRSPPPALHPALDAGHLTLRPLVRRYNIYCPRGRATEEGNGFVHPALVREVASVGGEVGLRAGRALSKWGVGEDDVAEEVVRACEHVAEMLDGGIKERGVLDVLVGVGVLEGGMCRRLGRGDRSGVRRKETSL